jgi:hypothetical protein
MNQNAMLFMILKQEIMQIPFKGTVGYIPLKEDLEPYKVFTSPMDLNNLQNQRIHVLNLDDNELVDKYIYNIFNNKKDFNQFMSKAIYIYITQVNDITDNISNKFWEGTGFDKISHEIFN